MNRAESAYAMMAARKMNCAQCVLTSFCEELRLDKVLAIKVAMGFGGGMGHTGQTCGAVTGAYMVLGLKQDLNSSNAQETKEKTYLRVREFTREFIKRNGTINCSELLNYNLAKTEELEKAREKGVFITRCPKFVSDSVEILESMK
jgi:C_GCAxxG_C_C family probable redox protein